MSKRPGQRTGPLTSPHSEGGRQEEPGICRLDPQQGYDLWAATYDATPNVVVSMDARHTPRFLKTRAAERVLDAGCGTGRHLSDLAACGCRPVGVDFSAEMLRVARRRLPGVPLVHAALEGALPFVTGCFDGALCALVGEHLADLLAAFHGLRRVLKPGGWLVFSVYHPAMAAAGREARFRRDGVEYRLGAVRYTLEDYLAALREAGFGYLSWHEFNADEALAASIPGAEKYLNSPVLLVIEATRIR